MDKVFQIGAVILIGIAAYFFWNDQREPAFVLGVLGAVSFFLGVRMQAGKRVAERTRERLEIEAARTGFGFENDFEYNEGNEKKEHVKSRRYNEE